MADELKTDPKGKIDSEGIFISFFQGPTRLWEFHPDDVTSVGLYRDHGQNHEVIVTVNREYDVIETTLGFDELNARLSRELKITLVTNKAFPSSTLGVVIWPSHLAGAALWHFYVISPGGLFRSVSPDTPDALRNLNRSVLREMTRFATPRLPAGFPQSLMNIGFLYKGDIGWRKDDAVLAVEWFHRKGIAVVAAELWIVKNAVVWPHIKTLMGVVAYSTHTEPQSSETWEKFVNRSSSEIKDFIWQFTWPENSEESPQSDVRFCLTWVWKEWLEEDGFKFPN